MYCEYFLLSNQLGMRLKGLVPNWENFRVEKFGILCRDVISPNFPDYSFRLKCQLPLPQGENVTRKDFFGSADLAFNVRLQTFKPRLAFAVQQVRMKTIFRAILISGVNPNPYPRPLVRMYLGFCSIVGISICYFSSFPIFSPRWIPLLPVFLLCLMLLNIAVVSVNHLEL